MNEQNKAIIVRICQEVGFPTTALVFSETGVEPDFSKVKQDDPRWKKLFQAIAKVIRD